MFSASYDLLQVSWCGHFQLAICENRKREFPFCCLSWSWEKTLLLTYNHPDISLWCNPHNRSQANTQADRQPNAHPSVLLSATSTQCKVERVILDKSGCYLVANWCVCVCAQHTLKICVFYLSSLFAVCLFWRHPLKMQKTSQWPPCKKISYTYLNFSHQFCTSDSGVKLQLKKTKPQ